MGERSSYPHGTFCWADLSTPDPAGAKAFYGALFGWDGEDVPVGEGATYTMLRLEGRDAAGLYAQPEDQRAQRVPPNWLSHVSVTDVDAVAARVPELGGTEVAAPFEVMEAGRMALAADPTGAVFALWQPGAHVGAAVVNAPGALSLNQLNTDDPERAATFYAELLGWDVARQETGGETGETDLWGIFNDGRLNGGMMRLPPDAGAPPHWLVYFGADEVNDALARARELGGAALVPATAVPGGHIGIARDPQGAVFAVFAGRFDP
jgi:predicted enzyme related to lactoylglutathione lyase